MRTQKENVYKFASNGIIPRFCSYPSSAPLADCECYRSDIKTGDVCEDTPVHPNSTTCRSEWVGDGIWMLDFALLRHHVICRL